MRLLTVVALFITVVCCELLNFEQFSDDVLNLGLVYNYDAIFVDLNEPLLDVLTRKLTLPKSIYHLTCGSIYRERILYFTEISTEAAKNFSICFKSHMLPVVFLRNCSTTPVAVRHITTVLQKLKVARAIHVVYDSIHRNLTIIPYVYLHSKDSPSFTDLINPSVPINPTGLRYHVHYKFLYPYFYRTKQKTPPYLLGIDKQLTEVIASSQNATIVYHYYTGTENSSIVDINVQRMARTSDSTDRLYLPQWDAVCVVFPKRYQRLILLQFAKPFQTEVWILVATVLLARLIFPLDRPRLLLLSVVLIEFMLTACYEVKVIEYMTTLRNAPSPRTMAELISRGERFYVDALEIAFLKPYGSAIDVQVEHHSKQRFLGQGALLYFCKTGEAYINSGRNYDPATNDRRMILLRERLKPYPSSYGMAKGHPFRTAFERVLRWAFEAGIWRKIYDQYARVEQQFEPLVAPGEYLIGFRDLVPLWVVCGVGWMISSAVFVVELVWKIAQSRRLVIVDNGQTAWASICLCRKQ